MKKVLALVILAGTGLISCTGSNNEQADSIFYNGTIYTMDENSPQVEAVAVKDGKILFAGDLSSVKKLEGDSTEMIDLKGYTMTPGFIESHGHFMGMGFNKLELDLLNTTSYEEIIEKVKEAAEKAQPGDWITGRGWHQSKWDSIPGPVYKGFPVHNRLSAVSPNNPVFLRHASGHGGLANAKAMEIAGVNQLSVEKLQKEYEGGEIIRDELGNPTGIFTETTTELIASHIPPADDAKYYEAFEKAVENCHVNGITSFVDAGIDGRTIALYKKAKSNGDLGVRMYAMLDGGDRDLLEEWYKRGPEIDSVDHMLTIRSIKLYSDGALGSRGAWLLDDYLDRPGWTGNQIMPIKYIGKVANEGLEYGFQVCTHAIGDRANREVLDEYEAAFNAHPQVKDPRFRIEHAQHIDRADLGRFAKLHVIAAMQAIHMSSDRPWAIDRLGEKRIKEGAYMWQSLLKSGAVVVNGTDVPVEPVNPIACFYASVTRKTLKGTPEGGYEPEERMTRKQALKSYTLNGAYGEFTEDIKGSIEKGKLADFTVFSQDILTVDEHKLLDTEVEMTVLGGKTVFKNENY
ncbi:MAG: amidohydrolase [Cyclobacteriaceae bacterium]|nr:amidohydrolase [Cyclobacteriaceae bacterium]